MKTSHMPALVLAEDPLYPVGDRIISEENRRAGLGEAVVALELITCPLAVENLGGIV